MSFQTYGGNEMGNVLNVRQNYKSDEWTARETYYVQEIAKLNISTTPTTTEVMSLTAGIDSLLGEALLDFAYLKRKYDKFNQRLKIMEKEAFHVVKNDPNNATKKLTEAEIKGMVITYIKSHPIQLSPNNPKAVANLFVIIEGIEERYIYMDYVVGILKEKKMALFADKSMMQIEAGINPDNVKAS